MEKKKIVVKHACSAIQHVSIFTKAFPSNTFKVHRNYLFWAFTTNLTLVAVVTQERVFSGGWCQDKSLRVIVGQKIPGEGSGKGSWRISVRRQFPGMVDRAIAIDLLIGKRYNNKTTTKEGMRCTISSRLRVLYYISCNTCRLTRDWASNSG